MYLSTTHSSLRYVKLENIPVSKLVFFSLARDKTKTSERIYGKHIIWAIYLYIREGVKYLDSLKSVNNSYFIICRIIVPKIFCMKTRYTLSPPPSNLQICSANLCLK